MTSRRILPLAYVLLLGAAVFAITALPQGRAAEPHVRLTAERLVQAEQPVQITHAGDGTGRLFVVEKAGRIRILEGGVLLAPPFLDITSQVLSRGFEQGLLSVAFHPEFAENGLLFVNYTHLSGDSVVARYRVQPGGSAVDAASAQVILQIPQPAGNHNGGMLAFGPDGYLYIGTGDGGGAGDPFATAQDPSSLLGKMLRLDVDTDEGYAIPPDNPFAHDLGIRDEIWAFGLRNPWRYSFDRQTGDLWIADVGQNAYEEINRQPANSAGSENYGWSLMEGTHCYPQDAACDPNGLTLPVAEYDHSLGCSITGGYVYRGLASEALHGVYVFGDYCSGRVWGLFPSADGEWVRHELLRTGQQISSFGQDEVGELYFTSLRDQGVYRLVPRDLE